MWNSWQTKGIGLPTCNVPGRTVYEPVPAFPDSADRRYFEQTGHSLSFSFKNYWDTNGGLPAFGYPLIKEFDERNVDLQQTFTTQYLERERFELHLENVGVPYLVLLGRLGDELLASSGRDWRQQRPSTVANNTKALLGVRTQGAILNRDSSSHWRLERSIASWR